MLIKDLLFKEKLSRLLRAAKRVKDSQDVFVDEVEIEGSWILGHALELLFTLSTMKTKVLIVREVLTDQLAAFHRLRDLSQDGSRLKEVYGDTTSSLTRLQCDLMCEPLLFKVIEVHKDTLTWLSFVTYGLGHYVSSVKVIENLRPDCRVQILFYTFHKFRYGNLCADEKQNILALVSSYSNRVDVYCAVCDVDDIVSLE